MKRIPFDHLAERTQRITATAAALLFLVSASTAPAQNSYGWTISGSATDAFVVSDAPVQGLNTIYVWYACNWGDGITAAEMGLSPAPLAPLAPMNGFLNGSTSPETLLLVIGGCPNAPLLAGSLLYIDALGSGIEVCFVPSVDNGFNLTVDCLTGSGWDHAFFGYSSTANPPCMPPLDSCFFDLPLAIEDVSWGGMKALYR